MNDFRVLPKASTDAAIDALVTMPRAEFLRFCAESDDLTHEQTQRLLAQAVERLSRAPNDEGPQLVAATLRQASHTPTIFVGELDTGDQLLILYSDGILKLFANDELVEYVNVQAQVSAGSSMVLSYFKVQALLSHVLVFPPDDAVMLKRIPKK